MKKSILFLTFLTMISCKNRDNSAAEFSYVVERFADMEVLRYRVPIEELTLQQKELLYYLHKAGEQGRDILFDQNGKYNLLIRSVLEEVYTNFKGEKTADFQAFEVYLKRVWVSNSIHHHYGNDKFEPEFSQAFFEAEVEKLPTAFFEKIQLSKEELLKEIVPVIFDKNVLKKRVVQDSGVDLVVASAGNYYEGVTQKEAENFYSSMKDTTDKEPVLFGLNSRLVKGDGGLQEEVYKVGGKYSPAIEKIIFWLEKAKNVAENPQQKAVIETLVKFYQTGDLKTFDEYSILWTLDTVSRIDFVNGFIETYGDPLGVKGAWESIVNFRNETATRRTEIISANAQWFEDNSPTQKRFKKEKVRGVSAKVINAASLAGDCYPTTPIGINLPNSAWIRAAHGSKSVTIENITEAYDRAAQGNGFAEEFVWSNEELELLKKYRFQTDNLHTDLHECLGHGSGKLLEGVDPDALKAYGGTIEEARADLFGLYFMADEKMVSLGLLPDKNAYKAHYYSYFMNGLLTQLVRIEPGKNIEEAHMRNRQLIAAWVLEKSAETKAVEIVQRDGKEFVVVNDYEKLRSLLGELLAEIQRIKSEGDYQAAHDLVENYGVKIDLERHQKILARYKRLNLAPYKAFVNPRYEAIFDENGKFLDLKIDYTEGYAEQHLRYSRQNGWLAK